ncbi:MAG: S-layer homology domain-containing protein, partial [Hyphomonadaceae bacterium]|nr:S-layer homology domain-containing protein [Clostridia bacterium]
GSGKIDWGTNGDNYVMFEFKSIYSGVNAPAAMNAAKETYAKTANPPIVALKLYTKDGTFIKDVSKMGFVWGICEDGLLFTAYDRGDLGYFFSNNKGYKYGNSLAITPKTGLVSDLSILNDYDATATVLKESEVKKPNGFVDLGGVPTSWAVSEVGLAKNESLVISEITDNYQKNITREEFCKLVVKLYAQIGGELPAAGVSKFKDTSTQEIVIANKLGIVNGVSEVEFAPKADITREQIAAMMKRMIDLKIKTSSTNDLKKYADYSKVSSWALDSLTYLNGLNIIKGVSDTEIAPKQNTTREQAILIAYRIFKHLSQK